MCNGALLFMVTQQLGAKTSLPALLLLTKHWLCSWSGMMMTLSRQQCTSPSNTVADGNHLHHHTWALRHMPAQQTKTHTQSLCIMYSKYPGSISHDQYPGSIQGFQVGQSRYYMTSILVVSRDSRQYIHDQYPATRAQCVHSREKQCYP